MFVSVLPVCVLFLDCKNLSILYFGLLIVDILAFQFFPMLVVVVVVVMVVVVVNVLSHSMTVGREMFLVCFFRGRAPRPFPPLLSY